MKKCPKLCVQKGNGKRADIAFVNVPNPKLPKKRKRIYFGSPSDPETHKKYLKFKFRWDSGENVFDHPLPTAETQTLSLGELFERFLLDHRGVYKKGPTGCCAQWLKYKRVASYLSAYKDMAVEDFDVIQLRAFQKELDQNGDFTLETINGYISCVKCVYKWGRLEGLVSREAANDIRSLPPLKLGKCHSRPNKKRKAVPLEVVEKTLPHLPPIPRTIIELLIHTGARPAEICSMRVEEIDRSEQTWLYSPTHHKTEHKGKPRVIALGPRARKLLTDWLKKHPYRKGYVFRPAQFRHRTTAPYYSSNALHTAIRRATRKAGVMAWYPYQTRHAVAELITKKYGVIKAQKVLGHANLNTTEVYLDQNIEESVGVIEEIG